MAGKEPAFKYSSQRVVTSYVKSLAEFVPIPVENSSNGKMVEMVASQKALYSFFLDLYKNLFEQPGEFGLPLVEDQSIGEDEPHEKEKKQEVKRLLDKPRKMITNGLDFLMLAGIHGVFEGNAFFLEEYGSWVKKSNISPKFSQGLETAGLLRHENSGRLESTQFPEMMPALQALAKSCSEYKSDTLGKFQFGRCDFRALQQYSPEAIDLYRVFEGEDYARTTELHQYFDEKNFKTQCDIHGPSAWVVKYQGNRKVKATPLFQIEYEERHSRPLRMQIKCASTHRIAELLPEQSQALQEDFIKRTYACRGDQCGWCRNSKTLGPSILEYNGAVKTVCWYTNPDIHEIDENTVELIRQYEQMHAHLAYGE
jgi:hypothetical protein